MMKLSLFLLTCYLGFTSSFRTNNALCRSSFRLFSSTPQAIQASLPSPLIDAQGNAIESAEVIAGLVDNQRVALYFGASWCEDCQNLEFMLAQYRKALSGSDQPIQLIYVPCDQSQEDQLSQMQKLELEVGVPLGETADALKQQYGVWPDVDIERFGGVSREIAGGEEANSIASVKRYFGTASEDIWGDKEEVAVDRVPIIEKVENVMDESGRRSGIPAFVVLDKTGGEFCFLNAERDSISCLSDWPLDDPQNIW